MFYEYLLDSNPKSIKITFCCDFNCILDCSELFLYLNHIIMLVDRIGETIRNRRKELCSFWPREMASDSFSIITERVNNSEKLVLSQ